MFCYVYCVFTANISLKHVISKIYPLGKYRSYRKVSRVYLGNPVNIFIHCTPIEYTMHRRSLVTRFESVCIARETGPSKEFLRSWCHGDINIEFRVCLKPNLKCSLESFECIWRSQMYRRFPHTCRCLRFSRRMTFILFLVIFHVERFRGSSV